MSLFDRLHDRGFKLSCCGRAAELQTKDLDCSLTNYEVRYWWQLKPRNHPWAHVPKRRWVEAYTHCGPCKRYWDAEYRVSWRGWVMGPPKVREFISKL